MSYAPVVAGQAMRAVAPQFMDTLNNVGGAGRGNVASRAGIAGRSYDDVFRNAESQGISMTELAEEAAKRAQALGQQDTRFQQGVGMENLAFSRGIQADNMRQSAYNDMARDSLNNRSRIAEGLIDSYNQARSNAANLMANTLRF